MKSFVEFYNDNFGESLKNIILEVKKSDKFGYEFREYFISKLKEYQKENPDIQIAKSDTTRQSSEHHKELILLNTPVDDAESFINILKDILQINSNNFEYNNFSVNIGEYKLYKDKNNSENHASGTYKGVELTFSKEDIKYNYFILNSEGTNLGLSAEKYITYIWNNPNFSKEENYSSFKNYVTNVEGIKYSESKAKLAFKGWEESCTNTIEIIKKQIGIEQNDYIMYCKDTFNNDKNINENIKTILNIYNFSGKIGNIIKQSWPTKDKYNPADVFLVSKDLEKINECLNNLSPDDTEENITNMLNNFCIDKIIIPISLKKVSSNGKAEFKEKIEKAQKYNLEVDSINFSNTEDSKSAVLKFKEKYGLLWRLSTSAPRIELLPLNKDEKHRLGSGTAMAYINLKVDVSTKKNKEIQKGFIEKSTLYNINTNDISNFISNCKTANITLTKGGNNKTITKTNDLNTNSIPVQMIIGMSNRYFELNSGKTLQDFFNSCISWCLIESNSAYWLIS